MKLLITAGGTREKIDDVRHITNKSTGTLGCAIAEAFLRREETQRIFYVCGMGAKAPALGGRVEILRISDTDELRETVGEILGGNRMDGIIHSMAVSDYTVDAALSVSALCRELAGRLSGVERSAPELSLRLEEAMTACLQEAGRVQHSKISSDADRLMLALKRTPKIIGIFKQLQPEAVLLGFKLLSNVGPKALLQAGEELMRRNRCDLVFANDLAEISPASHSGYLLRADGSHRKIEGRQAVADALADAVAGLIAERRKQA
ncbi:hypothetical protein SDC9_141676 [bioreactor metagenome]|uniref:DNA/pantothenate metabolism flavoprotein C-terminal domain-containing protein n=1 Tax=bioreactor metagenome TaxID=1076179 RepID=A0A645DYD3_9ZZZZ